MGIVFKYKILSDNFSNDAKKPVIKITLIGNSQTSIDVIGLLDSGADVSVIPKGLADFLNLKLEEKDKAKGLEERLIFGIVHFM